MKKLAIILLSIALVCSCGLIAFADAYSITVNNAIPGETYKAFKILDASISATPANGDTPAGQTISYTITPASQWWDVLITPASGATSPYAADPHPTTFEVDGLRFTKTTVVDNGQPVYSVVRAAGNHSASENAEFAEDLAAKLYGALSGKTTTYVEVAPDAVSPAEKSSVTFNLSEPGYYFVTTSVGSFCIIDTNNRNVTVNDKNDIPRIDKQVSKNGTSGWTDDSVNASVGDRVYFKLEVTDGKGTNQPITIDDYMTPGLSLYYATSAAVGDHDIVVTVDGTPVTAGANTFTISNLNSNDPEDPDFTITFAASYVSTLDEESEVIVTYSAVLNEDAVVDGTLDANDNELFNTNDVTLTYNHWESNDSVKVETYEFDLVKTMNDTYNYRLLNGAEFKMYTALSNGNEIPLVLEDTIYEVDPNTGEQTTTVKSRIYRKALAGETPVDHIDAGVATIRGVGNGTYYLEETAAPDGYNKLQTRQSITINGNNQKAAFLANGNYDTTNGAALQVINSTGSVLPSTGGIGTYLFYGIGAILVVGAVVVLVSKKRMHAYSE